MLQGVTWLTIGLSVQAKADDCFRKQGKHLGLKLFGVRDRGASLERVRIGSESVAWRCLGGVSASIAAQWAATYPKRVRLGRRNWRARSWPANTLHSWVLVLGCPKDLLFVLLSLDTYTSTRAPPHTAQLWLTSAGFDIHP